MRDKAKSLVAALQRLGYEAYFAGGAVRDALLGRVPKDYDIVTDARPDQIESIFSDYKTIPTGRQFGVITVIVDGDEFQIATYRADGAYSDGRRPDSVRFVATIEEDLARRDFTVNAMAYDPIRDRLIDPFGGQKDLEQKTLKFVGDPWDRICEDNLRLLRAVRFVTRLDFHFAKVDNYDNFLKSFAHMIRRVSRERITQEFKELLLHPKGLLMMEIYGMVEHVVPGIESLWGLAGQQDPTHHAEGNVWTHTQRVVDELRKFEPNNFELLLAGLLHDIGKPATQKCHSDGKVSNHAHADVGARMAENICSYWLKLSNEQTDFVVELVKNHMRMHDVQKMGKAKLTQLAEHPHIQEMVWLQHADAVGRDTCQPKGSNLEFMTNKLAELQALKPSQRPGAKSIVTGEFLIARGYKPGPHFKTILEAAREAQLEGQFDDSTVSDWFEGFETYTT